MWVRVPSAGEQGASAFEVVFAVLFMFAVGAMTGPWEFREAEAKHQSASRASKEAERFLKESYHAWAVKEEAYRKALAERITELRADGVAATLAKDLARGDTKVARLKMESMIAEGVTEAARQRAFAAQADRRAVEGLADWSKRRELAEVG